MNVPNEELDGMRALAGRLKQSVSYATHYTGRRQVETLEQAARLAAQLETRLEQAGAQRPAHTAPAPDVPLALLDTPANRRYAEKLREAWEAGLEVDRERYGPGIGTDGCAQVIEMVLADVEQEIGGPVGRVRE